MSDLKAIERNKDIGSSNSLLVKGLVPGIIYGKGTEPTKIALEDTPYASIADLFSGPTAIAYSDDPVAPAKVSVEFEKKFENFKIIGGSYEGEKIDLEKINFLASLPSLDSIRGKLLGLLNAPAQKIASILQVPGGQLAQVMSSRSKELGKSN